MRQDKKKIRNLRLITDAALEYRASNPSLPIDKELYMEHDEKVMNMMIEFLEDE